MNSPKTCSTKSTPFLGKIHVHRFDTVHIIDTPIGGPTMTTLCGVFERRATSAGSGQLGARLSTGGKRSAARRRREELPPATPAPPALHRTAVRVGGWLCKQILEFVPAWEKRVGLRRTDRCWIRERPSRSLQSRCVIYTVVIFFFPLSDADVFTFASCFKSIHNGSVLWMNTIITKLHYWGS